MADIARLVAALELESSKFHKEIDRVNNTLKRLEGNAKKKLGSIESAFKKFVGVAAVVASVNKLAGSIKSLIDEADQLRDFSQQVGISTETLSELGAVAEQFGVSSQKLQQGLATLNSNLAGAASGNEKAAQAFRLLGLSATDGQGRIKTLEQAFGEVADAIAKLPKGSALAQRALEKLLGVAELAPLFQEGAAAIERYRREAAQAGATVTSKFAAKVDELNDALAKQKTAFASLGREIASVVAGPLTSFANAITDILSARKFANSRIGLELEIKRVRKQLEEGGFRAKYFSNLPVELGQLEKKYRELPPVIDAVTQATDKGTEAAKAHEAQLLANEKAEKERVKRQADAAKAASEAQQVFEAHATAAINLSRELASQETEILDRANDQNLISFAEYYNKRAQIQRDAIDLEISQQQKLLGTGIDASERVQILGQIEVLKRQRDAITNQAVASIAESEREIADSLRDIRAELLEAQGDEVGAATIRLQAQYEDLLERLKAESNTAGIEIVNALFNERLVSEQLGSIQREYSEFSSRLSAQQDVIQAQQETGLLSERQARKEIIKLQKAALPELQKLIEAQRLLALETANPAAHNALLQLEADYIRLANVGNETALQIKDAFESGVIAALQEVAPTIETGIKAFDKFANTVIQRINDIAAEITAQALGDLLFGAFGGFGGSSFGGGGGSLPLASDLLAHGGRAYAGQSYIVGEEGPELFSPDSNGTVIPNGEYGMGRSVVVNINVSAPSGRLSQESIDQVATRGGLAVRRAMARNS